MNPEQENKDDYPFVRPFPDVPSAQQHWETLENPSDIDFFKLTEQARSTSEAWEQEGFKTIRSYLDLEGNLVVVASQTNDGQQIRRLLVNGSVIDIPSVLHGDDFHTDLTIDNKRLYYNKQNIYDTGKVASQSDIPLELWTAVEKFGNRLYEDEIEPGKWLLHGGNPDNASGYALDVMKQEVDERKDDAAAFTKRRGQLTHQRALEARDLVEMPLNPTLENMAEYNEARRRAYRAELKFQNSLDDDDFR